MTLSSKIASFEIRLQHDIDEQYQYKPGETLRGYVTIRLNEPTKIRTLGIQIKGESVVSWTGVKKKQSVEYKAGETYVNVTKLLVQTLGDVDTLSRGTHDFPFQYQLPYGLPSSYIGKYGSITYIVKATMVGESKYMVTSPLITSEPFLVLRRLDIGPHKGMMGRYSVQRSRRLFGMCCLSGTLDVSFEINRQVQLPGEDIFMTCSVDNDSPHLVTALQANINMISTFYAQNNEMVSEQVVNKKRDEWEMDTGEGRKWNEVRLTVPPYIPESQLDGCDIIDTTYELQFVVEMKGRKSVQINVPLIIGTDGIQEEDLNLAMDTTLRNESKAAARPGPMHMWRPIEAGVTGHHHGDENENSKDISPKVPIPDIEKDPDFEDIQINDFDYEGKTFGGILGDEQIRSNPLYSSFYHQREQTMNERAADYNINDEWLDQDDENTRL